MTALNRTQFAELVAAQLPTNNLGQIQASNVRTVANDLADSVPFLDDVGVINVKDPPYNAVGDGSADDAEALQAAMDASTNGQVLIPTGTYNVYATTITVPGGVSVLMEPQAEILYSGVGVALLIAGDSGTVYRHGQYALRVRRETVAWGDGVSDVSSVGIRATNVREADFLIRACENFYIGLQLYGDGTGAVDNIIRLGLVRNNRYGIRPERVNGGWNNQNTYIGGQVRLDSDYANLAAAPGALLYMVSNGNLFLNVNLEGGIELPGKCVYLNGSYNQFLNCRYEEQGDGTFHIDTGATGTQVLGGYENFGPDGGLFDDDGLQSIIIGARGARFFGDIGTLGGAALIGEAVTDNNAITFSARSIASVPFFEVDGIGRARFYDGAGKGSVDHESILINAGNSSIDFGDVSGASAPVATWRATNSSTVDYQNKIHRIDTTGRLAVRATTLADAATTISLSAGAYFVTANTGATNLGTLSGGFDGQIFYVRAGDANTTIVNGASFKTQSGSNIVMASGQVVAFMATASSVAWQV